MNPVFVYGTLKNYNTPDTHMVSGKLFNLGPFPGIRLDGEHKVSGQIALVTDEKLAALDSYEGVPTLYTREKTVAQDINDPETAIDVWVYQWAGQTENLSEIEKWPV